MLGDFWPITEPITKTIAAKLLAADRNAGMTAAAPLPIPFYS